MNTYKNRPQVTLHHPQRRFSNPDYPQRIDAAFRRITADFDAANLSAIQPGRGGLNRKVFWGIFHSLFELALVASAWMSWRHVNLRFWLIAALIGHFSGRICKVEEAASQSIGLAKILSTLINERLSAQEKLALLQDAKVALSDQFKSLANDILEEKSKRFTEQNQTNLGALLDFLK